MMEAVKGCFESLRVRQGWGIGEIAEHLGVHYETARRLRAGEIKEPSFNLVAGLHRLAERSLDAWVGTTGMASASVDGSTLMEDGVREMVLAQLGVILKRGLTMRLAPTGHEGSMALEPAEGLGAGWAVDTETRTTVRTESRQTEDVLLKAGKALAEPLLEATGEPAARRPIKRRPRPTIAPPRSA